MALEVGVDIVFNSSEFKKGVKELKDGLADTQREFKKTEAQLELSGTKLDQLKNKHSSLGKQLEQQAALTGKYKQAVEQSARAQEEAKKRLETANAAYKQGKKQYGENSTELKKLNDEVQKATKGVESAGRQHTYWNNQLQKSETAEARLQKAVADANKDLQKQSSYAAQVSDAFKTAQARTEGVQKALSKTGRVLTTTVTAPLLAAGAAAVTMYSKFEEGQRKVGTVAKAAGATKEELASYKDGIIDVSNATGESVEVLNEALYDGISATGDTANALKLTEAAAKAARAGFTDTQTAVNGVTTVLNAYNMAGADAEKITNAMLVAQNRGKTTFAEMAPVMGDVASTAAGLGVSSDQLFASMAAVTANGLQTSKAVTGLKAALSNIAKPTSEAAKSAEELGLQLGEGVLKEKGLMKYLTDIREKIGENPTDEVVTGLSKVFGSVEGVNTILALTSEKGISVFNGAMEDMANGTDYVGQAFEDMSGTKSNQLKDSINELKNSFMEFGETAAPFVDMAAGALKGLSGWMKSLNDSDRERLVKIALAIGAIGPGLSAVSKGITVFNGAKSAIGALTKVVGSGSGGLTGSLAGASKGAGALKTVFTMLPTPIKIAAGAVGVAAVGLAAYKKKLDDAKQSLLNMGNELKAAKEKFDQNMLELDGTQDLIDRYRELEDLLNGGSLTPDKEKEALEERERILDVLAEKYPEIFNDHGSIDEAIKKTQELVDVEKVREKMALSAERRGKKAKQGELEDTITTNQKIIDDTQGRVEVLEELKKKMDGIGNTLAILDTDKLTMDEQQKQAAKENMTKDLQEVFTYAAEHGETDMAAYISSMRDNIIYGFSSNLNSDDDGALSNMWNGILGFSQLDEKLEEQSGKLSTAREEIEKARESYNELYDIEIQLRELDLPTSVEKAAENWGTLGEEGRKKFEEYERQVENLNKSFDLLEKDKYVTVHFTYDESGNKKGITTSAWGPWPKINAEATGTSYARAGLSVVNEEGPELIEGRDGSFRMAQGSPALTYLNEGDTVYTARETRKMAEGAKIPGFAKGKSSGKSAFQTARESFSHRQRTSEVSDADALAWWQNVMREFAADADAVKEAEEQVYSLTKKLREQAEKEAEDRRKKQVEAYKKRISDQEKLSKHWLDYEKEIHGMSIDDQIAAYKRMGDNYKRNLDDMLTNARLTEEETKDVMEDYYDYVREQEFTLAKLQKQKAREVFDFRKSLSESYTADRAYRNDWQAYGDSPIEAYNRVKEQFGERLAANDWTEEEYKQNLDAFGAELYGNVLENSRYWIQEQKDYDNILAEDVVSAYERIKQTANDFYAEGIISYREYNDTIREMTKAQYDERLKLLTDRVNEEYELRRQRIEQEYEQQEESETKADRAEELAEIQRKLKIFQGAVTIEGKNKLKELQDRLKQLTREQEKEARDKQKQAALDDLEEEQEAALAGASKYARELTGVYGQASEQMKTAFLTLMKQQDEQQRQMMQSGYDAVSRMVDNTGQKVEEFKGMMASMGVMAGALQTMLGPVLSAALTPRGAGISQSYVLNQANYNTIVEQADAEIFGNSAGRAFMRVAKCNG